jgi:hypothetical protein
MSMRYELFVHHKVAQSGNEKCIDLGLVSISFLFRQNRSRETPSFKARRQTAVHGATSCLSSSRDQGFCCCGRDSKCQRALCSKLTTGIRYISAATLHPIPPSSMTRKPLSTALALWWALIACSLDLTFSQVCPTNQFKMTIIFHSISLFSRRHHHQKHRATQTSINKKPATASAFINELHYQNEFTDIGEFVEVVVLTNSTTKVGGLVLYDGTTGAAYKNLTVKEAVSSSPAANAAAAATAPSSSVTYLVWNVANILDDNGPNGIALHDVAGVVSEFISYGGGSFLAIDGVAKGLASKDITKRQSENGSEFYSLQRIGTVGGGNRWVLAPSTRGAVNVLQNFGGCTAVRVLVSWSFLF